MNEVGIYTLYSNDKETTFFSSKCPSASAAARQWSIHIRAVQRRVKRNCHGPWKHFRQEKIRLTSYSWKDGESFCCFNWSGRKFDAIFCWSQCFSKYCCVSFNSYISSVRSMHSRCFSNDMWVDVANNSLEVCIHFETAVGTHKVLIPSFCRHNGLNGWMNV